MGFLLSAMEQALQGMWMKTADPFSGVSQINSRGREVKRDTFYCVSSCILDASAPLPALCWKQGLLLPAPKGCYVTEHQS